MAVVAIVLFSLAIFALIGTIIWWGFSLLSDNTGVMPETHEGVVFRLGKIRPKPITQGIFSRLVGLNRIFKVNIQEQDVHIEPQSVILDGGAAVTMQLSLVIRVLDSCKVVRNYENYFDIIRKYSEQAVQSALRGTEIRRIWAAAQDDGNGTINDELLAELRALIEPMGIEICGCRLFDFHFPNHIEEALSREVTQKQDSAADMYRAKVEAELSQLYLEAARGYCDEDAPHSEVMRVALELRRNNTIEDMNAGGLVST